MWHELECLYTQAAANQNGTAPENGNISSPFSPQTYMQQQPKQKPQHPLFNSEALEAWQPFPSKPPLEEQDGMDRTRPANDPPQQQQEQQEPNTKQNRGIFSFLTGGRCVHLMNGLCIVCCRKALQKIVVMRNKGVQL
jgi:hypothetical protein